MEQKESTVSGSPGDSETNSPPVSRAEAPQVMNINMNMAAEDMSVEGSFVAATTIPPALTSDAGSGNQASSSLDLFGNKKKRGRPRKYDSDGNLRVQPFHHPHHQAGPGGALTLQPGFSFSPSSPPSDGLKSPLKRGRGRPPGSGNWQLLASLGELYANTAGGDFTPHVITVNTGEDVAGKILSLAHKGPRGICILSANGAVSNVTIRQPGSSGGILTYEGRFEILSLSGSFTVSETGGVRRSGGLSVSLAGTDGRVIGGGVAGLLLAASPIQMVVGSFMPNGYKAQKRRNHSDNATGSRTPAAQHVLTEARTIFQPKLEGETCLISSSSLQEERPRGKAHCASDQQIPNATSPLTLSLNGSQHI
ncbi:AT-hook motif nuclear-localized protein 10 [Manihot esculenta]|uniref:AT-hook motif nuclear-localized protein n=1 Tax=Manihot esculenta TaxID=3983 RepID=A0A2C9V8I9_MANES|nr:AT-hook motif nuclear-localized protein 10 [Manihot esculenta]OAY40947.1 hypothetical protein MANES_09G060752v8 [Manihot esculenta]